MPFSSNIIVCGKESPSNKLYKIFIYLQYRINKLVIIEVKKIRNFLTDEFIKIIEKTGT